MKVGEPLWESSLIMGVSSFSKSATRPGATPNNSCSSPTCTSTTLSREPTEMADNTLNGKVPPPLEKFCIFRAYQAKAKMRKQ